MFLLPLAMKNMLRYSRRSLITAIAIMAGIAVYIGADSMFAGIAQDSERNFVFYEAGAAEVMDPRYFKEMDYLPLKYAIPDPGAVRNSLSALGYSTTPRIRFMGELFFGDVSQQVIMIAVDPASEGSVLRVKETVIEGRYLESRDEGLVIGSWLADDLDVRVGSYLTLRTRTQGDATQTAELEVVGIVETPNPYLNTGVGFITLSNADGLLQMEGTVTEILIGSEDWKKPEKIAEEAAKAIGSASGPIIKTWHDLGKDFIMMVQSHQVIYGLMLLIVMVIAGVGIANTMLMAVYERFKEIGMMRALGLPDRSLRAVLLMEAGGIGFIGAVGGVLFGGALAFYLVRWGIDYSSLIGKMRMGYRISGVFRGAWNPSAMIVGLALGVLISMVVSLIPASRALRRGITDCLRHV
jgi:putative ABC transport system permease protein